MYIQSSGQVCEVGGLNYIGCPRLGLISVCETPLS